MACHAWLGRQSGRTAAHVHMLQLVTQQHELPDVQRTAVAAVSGMDARQPLLVLFGSQTGNAQVRC